MLVQLYVVLEEQNRDVVGQICGREGRVRGDRGNFNDLERQRFLVLELIAQFPFASLDGNLFGVESKDLTKIIVGLVFFDKSSRFQNGQGLCRFF